MKKLFYLLFAGAALTLASCATSPEDVATKIAEGKELSQKDYKVVLDYSKNVLTNIGDSIATYRGDRAELLRSMMELKKNSPYSDLFMRVVLEADTADFDSANQQLYRDIEKLQITNADEFSAATGNPSLRMDGSTNPGKAAAPAEADTVKPKMDPDKTLIPRGRPL